MGASRNLNKRLRLSECSKKASIRMVDSHAISSLHIYAYLGAKSLFSCCGTFICFVSALPSLSSWPVVSSTKVTSSSAASPVLPDLLSVASLSPGLSKAEGNILKPSVVIFGLGGDGGDGGDGGWSGGDGGESGGWSCGGD